MDQGLDKRFLHRIESVGFVAQQTMSDAVRQRAVSPKQFIQGFAVAGNGPAQQGFVTQRKREDTNGHVRAVLL